jgi:hypothetical protein
MQYVPTTLPGRRPLGPAPVAVVSAEPGALRTRSPIDVEQLAQASNGFGLTWHDGHLAPPLSRRVAQPHFELSNRQQCRLPER